MAKSKRSEAQRKNLYAKPLSIAFVSPMGHALYNPASKIVYGGSEVQLSLLSKQLATDKNLRVNVIVADKKFYQTTIADGVAVDVGFVLEKSVLNYILAPLTLMRTLWRIRPDVVVQRGAGPETGICALYARLTGAKFVYSVAHDMDVSEEYASKGITGKMFWFGINAAHRIILQNKDQAQLLLSWKPKLTSHSEIIKSSYPNHTPSVKKNGSILWVARSDAWKRPELFVKLAKALPKNKFVMIMPKSSDIATWDRVHTDAKKLKNVEFHEQVAFSKIQPYFDRASLFVNTSTYEGFPNTFIQSCNGLTPIVSMQVNPENFLTEFGCGVCCNGDESLLVETVRRLSSSEADRVKMGKLAKKYFDSNHNIVSNTAKWLKNFSRL